MTRSRNAGQATPSVLEGHRALTHAAEFVTAVRGAVHAHSTRGKHLPPPPRLVDRRQVVRYAADTEALALARFESDQLAAEAVGFRPIAEHTWDRGRARPTLVAEFLFDPPMTIRRTMHLDAATASEAFAQDATTMALAGYVPENQKWQGTSFGTLAALTGSPKETYGWTGRGILEVSYRFDPDLAGEPITAVAIDDEAGVTSWPALDGLRGSGSGHVAE